MKHFFLRLMPVRAGKKNCSSWFGFDSSLIRFEISSNWNEPDQIQFEINSNQIQTGSGSIEMSSRTFMVRIS